MKTVSKRNRGKIGHHEGTIPADGLMIVSAFRYCLGRQTYIVSSCADWLIAYWDQIPENTRLVIARDLEEAFAHDARDRADKDAGKTVYGCRLGHDCDRQSWSEVRMLYRDPVCCQCGKPVRKVSQGTDAIGAMHLDGEVSCRACTTSICEACGNAVTDGQYFISNPKTRAIRHDSCPPSRVESV